MSRNWVCAAALVGLTITAFAARAAELNYVSAELTINPTNIVVTTLDGVVVTAEGYQAEQIDTATPIVYGPFPTNGPTERTQYFGTRTSGLDNQPGLGLLVEPVLGSSEDEFGQAAQPGLDNRPQTGAFPEIQFVLFRFDNPVDISQVVVDDTSNFGRSIFVAGGTGSPDISDLIGTLNGSEVQTLLDDPTDGAFIHNLQPALTSVDYLIVGTPPRDFPVGPLVSVGTVQQFYITAINLAQAVPVQDDDGDSIPNEQDNCPAEPNADQADNDNDGIGDACDDDDDNDGIADGVDNCSAISNADQSDLDGDGLGDVCDLDDDGDSVPDNVDNCPRVSNGDQSDADGDGIGDSCDDLTDSDGDGIGDEVDNCPAVANPSQEDIDNDGIGDVCDTDNDNDGVLDTNDNCPALPNADQSDIDSDGLGDACDGDDDGDGVLDANDNCTATPNPAQADLDADGLGDVCDNDDDGDDVSDDVDNCPLSSNADQLDTDGDGVGDICDPLTDSDDDGVGDGSDNCPLTPNSDQQDTDGDGVGDACDPLTDSDDDGVDDEFDNCPLIANSSQTDSDGDGIGDACDLLTDSDNDGIEDSIDQCPGTIPDSGTVDPRNGCSLDQLCPCYGPAGSGLVPWPTKGSFVSCVAKSSEAWLIEGLISQQQKDELVSQAAQSVCGEQ
jgi:hypothetical protein